MKCVSWIALCVLALASCAQAQTVSSQSSNPLIVASFDRPGWITDLGDPFGAWESDPRDQTQSCRARLVENPRLGKSGYSLMLDYDVDSPNPAYNGFWLKLPAIDARRYDTLRIVIKGDDQKGFTERLKIELKDRNRAASFTLSGITSKWVRMKIPLKAFGGIKKIKAVTEFVIVLDDKTVTEKVGALYLEEIAFESAG